MGEASVPSAHRRDFANIGLGGHAWQLWGAASFEKTAGWLGRWRRAAGFAICETEFTLAINDDFLAVRRRYGVPVPCVSRPCSTVGMDAEMRYAADVGGDMVAIKG